MKDDAQTQKTEYTVQHVVAGKVEDTKTYTGTAWINDKAPTITVEAGSLAQKTYTGYKYDGMSPEAKEGEAVASGTVISLNYVKDDAQTQKTKYTVKYTINGVDQPKDTIVVTDTAWVNENPAKIAIAKGGISAPANKYQGYKLDEQNPEYPAEGEKVESGSVYTVNYVNRTDLSYTVHYYWKDTNVEVANSKDVTGQTFGAPATETPIKVDGYTAVNPKEEKTFSIGVTNEDVIFYYYKNVTVTAENKSKTYGADDPELTAAVTTVDGPVSADTVGYTLNRESGENVGTYTITPKGEAVQGNYTVTYNPGVLTITPVTGEVTVTITGNTKTVTYNGEEQSVEGYTATITNDPSKLYTLNNIQFTGTAKASRTDVGTTNMGLKAEQFQNTSKNFTNVTFVVAKDGWLKINPYMISIEPTETTFKYNGEEPKVKTDKIEIRNENDGKGLLLNHHVESIETQGSGVDAGTYEWFSGHNAKILDGNNDVTANYQISYAAKTMTITPAPLKITTDSATKTYDGSALTAGGKIEGVVERDKKDVKLNITGSQTNAGTSNNIYTIEWGTAKATNYKIDEDIGKLTINPLEGVVVTITGNTDTVTYDGNLHTVEGYKVEFTKNPENLYNATDFKLNGEAKAAGTDAGTYNMGFVATSFENTNPNFKNVVFNITDGWLKITPKEIVPGENNKDLTATAPEDVVYNGESQQQKPIVKDGDKVLEEGKDYTLTYSEDTTNAGTVTVTITGKGNYGSKFEVTYKITRAPLKITTNSAEKTYDGSALTADGKIEGLVKGETATLKTTGSQTEVGESKNTYEIEWGDATKASNYKIAEEDIGTLKINARSGGGSSSKPTPEEELTPTPTPTPLPTLPTTPAPTTPARRVTRSTATVTQPTSRPTEQITENETPKAESEPEVIEDEETPLAPMATGAWALVNLILMLLTVLASLLLLLGYLGKKKYAKEDEYGNALHDANGNEIIDYTRNKKGFWRVASLIPAIAAVIAFALTENMRLPMVMTDRWTLLMVIIAVVQLIVAVLCKKKKESEEDENQANA